MVDDAHANVDVNKTNVKIYILTNMKNVTTLKHSKTESPKTPGGISKSLLTPCRRLGLSRKWKNAGPSPFVSPLSSCNSNSVEVKVDKKPTRKRKERITDEEHEDCSEERPGTPVANDIPTIKDEITPASSKQDGILGTPSRQVEVTRKKSKTLLAAITNCKENVVVKNDNNIPLENDTQEVNDNFINRVETENNEQIIVPIIEPVATPVKVKSKSKRVLKSDTEITSNYIETERKENINILPNKDKEEKVSYVVKPRSPNDLTKECIVVIQKKIFKTDKNLPKKDKKVIDTSKNRVSQTLFDSDNDEVPLSHINKKRTLEAEVTSEIINLDEDDDFAEASKIVVKKLVDKNTSTGSLNAASKSKAKNKKQLTTQKMLQVNVAPKPLSQSSNSFDDDEDFEFDKKRTILVRKTYDKPTTKPLKAKSTGSITQRDVDELKARIETKKKLLLAKAMTEDTAELRGLIKRWQRGCQDALVDLMELMKTKFPDKQNMDYSEILQTLKIPATLVGYDSDNDCFITPDDANIILSKFNEL